MFSPGIAAACGLAFAARYRDSEYARGRLSRKWRLEITVSHILIVDDEEAVCWALKKALTAEGHRVAVTASAEEAFVQAEKQTPDAIILDVRLPGLDGLSALGGKT